MRVPVEDIAFHRAHILRPLLLDMDKSPLTPTKGKVLNARKQKFLAVHQIINVK